MLGVPLPWNGVFAVEATLCLALVIDAIETDNALEEDVQFRVTAGILGHLEERLEDIGDDLFEVLHHTTRLVHIVKTGHLN